MIADLGGKEILNAGRRIREPREGHAEGSEALLPAHENPCQLENAKSEAKQYEAQVRHALRRVWRDEFVDLVAQMMDWQQNYFRTRATSALKYARDLERRVDRALDEDLEQKQGLLF